MQENQTETKPKIGRKPIANKKMPITIYRPKNEIEKMGGLSDARRIINKLVDEFIESKTDIQTFLNS
jgi:hypothetical protein